MERPASSSGALGAPRRPLGPRTLPLKRHSTTSVGSHSRELSRAGSVKSLSSISSLGGNGGEDGQEEAEEGEEETTGTPKNNNPAATAIVIDEEEEITSTTPNNNPIVPIVEGTVDPSPPPSPRPPTVMSLADPPPTLTVPPLPTFPSGATSPSYKALPYEAAQWTFTSHELQDIVSRAIRCSARESFVRLLSLKLLDTILPDELARLADTRLTTTGKYRWSVQRRSMLMQGLWAIIISSSGLDSLTGAATSLLTQLSEVVADCDRMVEELVKVGDQVKDISSLVDNHWSSALAVALRKVHGPLEKKSHAFTYLDPKF